MGSGWLVSVAVIVPVTVIVVSMAVIRMVIVRVGTWRRIPRLNFRVRRFEEKSENCGDVEKTDCDEGYFHAADYSIKIQEHSHAYL